MYFIKKILIKTFINIYITKIKFTKFFKLFIILIRFY